MQVWSLLFLLLLQWMNSLPGTTLYRCLEGCSWNRPRVANGDWLHTVDRMGASGSSAQTERDSRRESVLWDCSSLCSSKAEFGAGDTVCTPAGLLRWKGSDLLTPSCPGDQSRGKTRRCNGFELKTTFVRFARQVAGACLRLYRRHQGHACVGA